MKIRTFRKMSDYRFGNRFNVCEVNLIGRVWNLRLMLSRRFGLSLWRDYHQVARLNYPIVCLRAAESLRKSVE